MDDKAQKNNELHTAKPADSRAAGGGGGRTHARTALHASTSLHARTSLPDADITPAPTAPVLARFATFPQIIARDERGRGVMLPRDLQAPLNLLLVAWYRGQRVQTRTWAEAASALGRKHRGQLGVYEVPILDRYDPPFSVDLLWPGRRDALREAGVRTMQIDADGAGDVVREALAVHTSAMVKVLLIDTLGRVHWHSDGVCTAEKQAALQRAVARAALGDGAHVTM